MYIIVLKDYKRNFQVRRVPNFEMRLASRGGRDFRPEWR